MISEESLKRISFIRNHEIRSQNQQRLCVIYNLLELYWQFGLMRAEAVRSQMTIDACSRDFCAIIHSFSISSRSLHIVVVVLI